MAAGLDTSTRATSQITSWSSPPSGRTDTFGKVFTLIERLHVEGDEYVRQLATIGYLEDLQNLSTPAPGRASKTGEGLLGSRIFSQ